MAVFQNVSSLISQKKKKKKKRHFLKVGKETGIIKKRERGKRGRRKYSVL